MLDSNAAELGPRAYLAPCRSFCHGVPGCGKIHLAVALTTLTVEAGYRGYFTTADNLCRTLVRASIEGNLSSTMKSFTAPTVSVIDDVGLLPLSGTEASAVFFQVV